MIVLRKLKGEAKEELFTEPIEHHHHVGKDFGKGRIRVLRLGSAGLTVGDGTVRVAVPLDELLELAEPHLRKAKA